MRVDHVISSRFCPSTLLLMIFLANRLARVVPWMVLASVLLVLNMSGRRLPEKKDARPGFWQLCKAWF